MSIASNPARSPGPPPPLRTVWPDNPEKPTRAPHWSFNGSLAHKQRAAYRQAEIARRNRIVMAAMLA